MGSRQEENPMSTEFTSVYFPYVLYISIQKVWGGKNFLKGMGRQELFFTII